MLITLYVITLYRGHIMLPVVNTRLLEEDYFPPFTAINEEVSASMLETLISFGRTRRQVGKVNL